jgi:DNA-binding protein YbaB
MEQLTARTARLRAGADEAVARLWARIESVKQAQQQALRATGEATSHDGSVHVVVDSTGVVTSIRLSPTVFQSTTPERLAQTVVATIQSAAGQARGRMSAELAPVRGDDSGAVARGLASMGIPRAEVPQVPRTAADPTVRQDTWGAPQEQRPPDWGAITPDQPAAEPMRPRVASHQPRHREPASDDERQDWETDERPW